MFGCLFVQTFNSAIIYDRDYGYSYFGFKVTCTTVTSALASAHSWSVHMRTCSPSPRPWSAPTSSRSMGKVTCTLRTNLVRKAWPCLLPLISAVAERPQHMLMRVAIGIHKEDLGSVLETYTLLSEKWFTHASPTLFNAGTCRPQLSSCFLLTMKDDSIDVGLSTSHHTMLLLDTLTRTHSPRVSMTL